MDGPVDLWKKPIGLGARVRLVAIKTHRGRVVSIAEDTVDLAWDDGTKWCAGYHVVAALIELVPEEEQRR